MDERERIGRAQEAKITGFQQLALLLHLIDANYKLEMAGVAEADIVEAQQSPPQSSLPVLVEHESPKKSGRRRALPVLVEHVEPKKKVRWLPIVM